MARNSSVPASLPPPYTATGTNSNSLRTNAKNFCTTAEILVGPKSTRFLLHTSLLTGQSPYFHAALNGPFLESTNQSINLPDVSVEMFELLISWLYTGSISPAPFKDGKPAYYTLLHLYILADRLCFEGLRNRIIDLISDLADQTNSVLTPSDTRILYEQISENAFVRKLVLDLFAFKKTEKLLAEHEDRWHAGFLRDLCVRLKRPCEQAMQRHRLRMWCPSSYPTTHPCENCHAIIPPRYGAVKCEDCFVTWCSACADVGVGMALWEDGNPHRLITHGDATKLSPEEGEEGMGMITDPRTGKKHRVRRWQSCKPWRGSRCMIYHEHKETEACADLFMGK